MPGAEVTLADIVPERAGLASALGVAFAAPEALPEDADLVFHASGNPEGLRTALHLVGFEAGSSSSAGTARARSRCRSARISTVAA